MRGKAQTFVAEESAVGITPAYAGKSKMSQEGTADAEDHPRICGEKVRWTVDDAVIIGSPPHMRGKESYKDECDVMSRITPAYAGKRQFR